MDQNSVAKLQLLHPKLRDIAILAYTQAINATPANVHPVIDQTYRTFSQSQALYNQGRTTPGQVVTWALPGHSWHNWALALDFHLIIDGKDVWPNDPANDPNWMIVVKIFESHGFNSGLYFPAGETDAPHLEHKMGQTISGLLALEEESKFIPGTTYIDF